MPFTKAQVQHIKKTIEEVTRCPIQAKVECTQAKGLSVQLNNGQATIAAEDKTALARGFFLLLKAEKDGKSTLDIRQTRHIDSCGAFIDCSRGAVMTVEAVNRYTAALAALGLNLIVLYTEDTYTVPEYPHFGHLRGRYTQKEWQEMDDYADSLGVELVPCIQTLAHLGQFLQWEPNEHLKDTPYCLLIDNDETYEFIEAEIRAIRACVRTKRLHIGMDEAHGVGLNRYFALNGPVDRFELLTRHLNRVLDICKQYDFAPCMWSDMFFRLGSKENEYYDLEADLPQRVIDMLPDVGMCYWDYYHTEAHWYEHMLTQHQKMGKPVLFAGGVWTWSGFLPNFDLTYATMLPALQKCAEHRVDTVMATMWGDDGNETDYFLALSMMPVFSESCWQASACKQVEMAELGAFLTGLPVKAQQAFAMFYPGAKDIRAGKSMVYCDLLYPLTEGLLPLDESISRFRKAREILAEYSNHADCAYADALFAIALEKAEIVRDIRSRYLNKDTAYLAAVAHEKIPQLLAAYERLITLHRAQWESSYKRNGWEVFALRYGAVTGRLKDVQYALLRYLDGSLKTLCELDEAPLPAKRKGGMQWYQIYTSPQA